MKFPCCLLFLACHVCDCFEECSNIYIFDPSINRTLDNRQRCSAENLSTNIPDSVMESHQSPPPTSVIIDFTLGDDSDDSDFYVAWDPTSTSTEPTDTMEVLEVVDLTDLTSEEDAEPEILPFHGPLLPPQGDGDAAGGPSRADVDTDTDSSLGYATSSGDSQGAPAPPSCSTCLTEPGTPHTVRPHRPRPERRCKSCIRVGECSVCGCEFRSYRR